MKYGKAAGDVRTLLSFTIPLILSGLFQQVFNWMDAFIVGNVEGELALAGIGATTSIYNLFVTVITGFTSGLSVLTAQQFGMGKRKEIGAILWAYTILLGICFNAISVAGALFTSRILRLLDTPANIFGSAKGYLRILFAGVPFLAVYNTFSAVLRGIGDSRAPFFAVLVSSGANVVLDLLFVAGMGYGAAGVAALLVRIVCSYGVWDVFGNMVVAYAEAFSWIFLLGILVWRYWMKYRSAAKD